MCTTCRYLGRSCLHSCQLHLHLSERSKSQLGSTVRHERSFSPGLLVLREMRRLFRLRRMLADWHVAPSCKCTPSFVRCPYTDFRGTEWERKDLKPPIIECGSRNDDMTRLLGYASETFSLMNGWTGWRTWSNELWDGANPMKSFLTFYKTLGHINDVRHNLSTHSNTFYVEAGRVRPRIVCVNEHEQPFEKYASLQPDWRSECQSVRGVIPILFSAVQIFESPVVLVCPRFWDWPDRPHQRNQENCPTLNQRKTAFNTEPRDLQLLLFKSYFLMLAVIVRGLPGNPPGPLSRISLNSRMRSPNICASLGADESLQTALAEMYYVAC